MVTVASVTAEDSKMDKLASLRAFVKVVELGSFSDRSQAAHSGDVETSFCALTAVRGGAPPSEPSPVRSVP